MCMIFVHNLSFDPSHLTIQVLHPQQQGAMLRPQVTVATTPMVTLRGQAPGRIMLGQPQVQLKQLHTGEDWS